MRAWQLEKIRRALHGYRLLHIRNGDLPSWREVRDQILFSDVTENEFPEDGREPDLKEEAVRRFAEGINKTFKPPEKLADVVRFLVAAKVLTTDELHDDQRTFVDVVLFHNRLGNRTKLAAQQHEALAPFYKAVGSQSPGEEIELLFIVEPPGTLVHVEEHFRFVYKDSPFAKRIYHRDGYEYQDVIRTGYGFSMTYEPNFNFFVRGEDRTDFIHYVRVPPFSEAVNNQNLYFLRYGSLPPRTISLFDGDPFHSTLHDLRIVCFVPVDEQAE